MGDELFRKRKFRRETEYRRRMAKRSPYNRVLYTTQQFEAPLEASNCQLVVEKLKTFIPEYEKGGKNFLVCLDGKNDEAIDNAKQLNKFHETSGTDNPSTKVYELVEFLKGLTAS